MEKNTTKVELTEERVREIVREIWGGLALPQAEASGSSHHSRNPQELAYTSHAKTDLHFLDYLNSATTQGNKP